IERLVNRAPLEERDATRAPGARSLDKADAAEQARERQLDALGASARRSADPRSAPLDSSEQGPSATRGLDLHTVLRRLGDLAINEVLVEAGPTLSGAFVQCGVADELLLYIAPKLLGPQARPLFALPLLEDLQLAHRFRIIEHLLIGDDLRVRL